MRVVTIGWLSTAGGQILHDLINGNGLSDTIAKCIYKSEAKCLGKNKSIL